MHIKIRAPKGADVMFQGTQERIPDDVESEVLLTGYYRSKVLGGELVDVLCVIAQAAAEAPAKAKPAVDNHKPAQKR